MEKNFHRFVKYFLKIHIDQNSVYYNVITMVFIISLTLVGYEMIKPSSRKTVRVLQ